MAILCVTCSCYHETINVVLYSVGTRIRSFFINLILTILAILRGVFITWLNAVNCFKKEHFKSCHLNDRTPHFYRELSRQ